MFTYKLKFSNGKKFQTTTKTLNEAQAKCLPLLTNEGDKVEILTPNGKVFTITKRATEYHWKHPGFLFNV